MKVWACSNTGTQFSFAKCYMGGLVKMDRKWSNFAKVISYKFNNVGARNNFFTSRNRFLLLFSQFAGSNHFLDFCSLVDLVVAIVDFISMNCIFPNVREILQFFYLAERFSHPLAVPTSICCKFSVNTVVCPNICYHCGKTNFKTFINFGGTTFAWLPYPFLTSLLSCWIITAMKVSEYALLL